MECKDVEKAAARLQGQIHNVKVTSSRTFSEMSSCQLFLKCENRQKTGSFKVRGAFNKLAKLKEAGRIFMICPSEPPAVGRIEKDMEKLGELYYLGYNDAMRCMDALKAYLGAARG